MSTGIATKKAGNTREGSNQQLDPPSQNYALYSENGKAAVNYRTRLFTGKEVRIRNDENGDIWFVAADICAILGYKNPTKTIEDNCSSNTKKITLDSDSGEQAYLAINEPDLYRLIIRSKKEEAQQFEKWVMEEVLPEIRKCGHYKVTRKLDYTPATTAAEAAEGPSAQVELFPRSLNVSFPKPLTQKMNSLKSRLAEQGHTFPTNKDFITYLVSKALEAIQ